MSKYFRLYELREKGIRTCHGGQLYHNLAFSLVRNNLKQSLDWKTITSINDTSKRPSQLIKHNLETEQSRKRRSTPLNIIGLSAFKFRNTWTPSAKWDKIFFPSGLSNYDKLNNVEQELCSTIRIVPNAFIAYKQLLTTENNKLGYLRLADARKLIKIDVNKTRVLYDFLVEHGFINKNIH